MMKVKITGFALFWALALFVLATTIYYWNFSIGFLSTGDGPPGWTGMVNAHDHLFYVDTIERLARDGVGYELNNDVGISFFYLVLGGLFFSGEVDYVSLALYVNLFFLLMTFVVYLKICDFYGFGFYARLAFFAGLHLIYFCQLINKDMLSVFLIVFSVYCGINRKLALLLLLIPFYAMVRQQLLVYVALFIFIQTAVWPLWRIFFAYIVTSLVAAYLVTHNSIIGSESLEGGFSSLVYSINEHYYVGYLLLNPIRVLQFVQDSMLSFFFITPDGAIDMGRALRVPQVLLLILMGYPLCVAVKRFRDGLQSVARPLYSALIAYLLAWLMNPTINARYVMLIAPVLVLMACYARQRYLLRRTQYV